MPLMKMTEAKSTYRPLAAMLLLMWAALAWADGTLTHMSGVVSVQKADGTTQPAAVGIRLADGDTLVTGAGGYVRMEMTDGGEIVLRPDSKLKIEGYKFVAAKPAEDSFVFSMLKGGLRTVTGLVGKRGNKDAYQLKTETATLGIRGTQFDLRVCQANCGALADGTYLAVRFGAVQTTNAQGTLAVAAGQVAYVPPKLPPVMLPRDPGIGFTPPPVIPKLDEKKKVQATAAQTQEAAAKPAAEQKPTEKSEVKDSKETKESKDAKESKQEAKPEAKPESKPEAKTEAKQEPKQESAAKTEGSKQPSASAAATATPQATPSPDKPAMPLLGAPAASSASGTECSVQ